MTSFNSRYILTFKSLVATSSGDYLETEETLGFSQHNIITFDHSKQHFNRIKVSSK